MANFDWQKLLTQWSRELIESDEFTEEIPPEVIVSGWLGYPGATCAQIAQAEARLGTLFPPSYREFLQVTNGWRQLNSNIYKLWSTEEVEWFAVRNQNWIDMWLLTDTTLGSSSNSTDEEYFVYGEEQDSDKIRVEYLQTALEVSDVSDSTVLLLNPQVVTAEGEWEGWFFASWLGGAKRYQSFWDMMQDQHQIFLDLLESLQDNN